MCLDLPRFFLASPFFLPGRFGHSLEKNRLFRPTTGAREPPRLPSHVMSVTFCFLCRHFAVSFQQACASPPDFNVGVGTGVLPLLCVAYGRPSAHGVGTTELGQYFANRRCEDPTEKVCDRGSRPPAPPLQCCVGKRAGSLPVGQKSCELGPRSRLAFNIEIGGRGGARRPLAHRTVARP